MKWKWLVIAKGLLVAGILVVYFLNRGPSVEAQVTPLFNAATSTASVTNSSTATVAANANRGFLMLQNDDGALIVYCAVNNAAATINNGIRLNALGGTIIFSPFVPLGAINCITTAAGPAKVLVTEGTR